MSLIVHIRKRLHNFELISDFETDGQLALLGASGSGKSMTLKCIAGIEKPDSGYIELNGRVLYTAAEKKRRLSVPELCTVSEYDGKKEYTCRNEGRKQNRKAEFPS